MKIVRYPKDFLWGASTASHQVEGDTHTQWDDWEKANAIRLAQTAPKRLSKLPNWGRIGNEATKPENYIAANGVEHYSRYVEDFRLLKKMNMNAFRFSVEWARLEPTEGQWNEQAVEHYRRYIAEMKKQGIESILTLWHWTMPTWFTQKGGFESRQNIHYFERYVTKVISEFNQELEFVIVLNEPSVYVSLGYLVGSWPPMRRNPLKTVRVYYNLAIAHRKAAKIIKSINPKISIGVAAQLGNIQPINKRNFVNKFVVKTVLYINNWWFLNRIRNDLDFIGINYYFTHYLNWFGKTKNPKAPLNDMGWYMEPGGIQPVIETAWQKYHKPIIITENGVADALDQYRQWWLSETLEVMQSILKKDVKLFGYLHWSLLDNFEWDSGWWPKFGLIAVDRRTMHRTIRPSALWLAKQISNLH